MQLSASRLEITYPQTTSLKPDPRNPRVHSDKQVRQIAKGIEAVKFLVAIPKRTSDRLGRLTAEAGKESPLSALANPYVLKNLKCIF